MMKVGFILLLQLALVFLATQNNSAISLCRNDELKALIDFKLSFSADPEEALSTWNIHQPECCTWVGIDCDKHTGHVVSIDLGANSLESHQLRPSLLALPLLASLDLSENNFTMTIPEFIGSLASLTYLDLSLSGFFGKIPPHLGNLTRLQTLDLEAFSIAFLYADDLLWLSHLSSLQELVLNEVDLSSASDWLSTLQMLPSLSDFECSSCSLSYAHPASLNSSTSLQILRVPHNNLINGLPDLSNISSLYQLVASSSRIDESLHSILHHLPTSLDYLDLSSNSLKGVVSYSIFSNFSRIQYLDLSDNHLLKVKFSRTQVPPFQLNTLMLGSCKIGHGFPNWVMTHTHLNTLDISSSGISGDIPSSFWNFSSRLYTLNISNNNLKGSIPNLSVRDVNYSVMDLSYNDFHGHVPLSIFSTLYLDLSNNKFSSFPSFHNELTDLHDLLIINLSNNRLSGPLPDWIFQFDGLQILNLAYNNLSGTIPGKIASLQKLSLLHLNSNKFSGELPDTMNNCTQLLILELGSNNFTGGVPLWLGESSKGLVFLSLRSNDFTGDLPSSLCQLQKLQVLDLSNNRISGSIPNCFDNFSSMATYKNIQDSFATGAPLHLSVVFTTGVPKSLDYGSIMWKGILANESGAILLLLNAIDLSNNCLTGEIPTGLTSIKYLRSLDLSRNNLNGSIPNNIGQLKSLEVLRLSSNSLSGEIPQSLADVTSLNTLNLSSNNLFGTIPTGTQLQSFDPSCYGGNPGLCGKPLPTLCPGLAPSTIAVRDHAEEEEEGGFDKEAFYGASGTGFAFGLLGIVGILIFHASSRHAFFHMASQVGDWIFVRGFLCHSRIKRSFGF